METPQKAKAAGEELKQLILQLALKYDDVKGMLDGSRTQARLADDINEKIKFVREQIWPTLSQNNADRLLYEKGRGVRTFQAERERLWSQTIRIYLKLFTHVSEPGLDRFLENPSHGSIRAELREGLRKQLETLTIPLLEDLETPGDDLLLLTYSLMLNVDDAILINQIADSDRTPLDSHSACLGMFGLLIEADRACQLGDMGRAYSYLLDAYNLIGMHDGARFVMRHLPEIAKKRRAKQNSEKSREQVNASKTRASELFCALRPLGEDGTTRHWEKASHAVAAVWKALENEAQNHGKEAPDVSYSTIEQLCRKLHKLDRDGGLLDIRVEVVQRMPDGSEQIVSID